jgi:hypothetical protein
MRQGHHRAVGAAGFGDAGDHFFGFEMADQPQAKGASALGNIKSPSLDILPFIP